jgi:hypothetical protein
MERKLARKWRSALVGSVAMLGAMTACTTAGYSDPIPKPVALPVTGVDPANPYSLPDANGFFYATANVYTCIQASAKINVSVLNNSNQQFRFTVAIVEGYSLNGNGTVLGSGAADIDGYGSIGGYSSDPVPAGCFTVHMVWSDRGANFTGTYEIDAQPAP